MTKGLSNKVVGQAGEFSVCAQLGKMGLVATPFSGNVPEFDLVAVDSDLNCLPIQVKTSSGSGGWITGDARKYCEIQGPVPGDRRQIVLELLKPLWPELVLVFVRLSTEPGVADRYYIATKAEVWRKVGESHRDWLKSHDYIRPRNPDSFHCAISQKQVDSWGWENRWEVVREGLKKAAAQPGSFRPAVT